jgi:hypothetical protein
LLEGQPGLSGPRNESVEAALTFSPGATFHGVAVVYYTRLRNVMIEDFANSVRRTFETDTHPRQLVGAELEGTWQPLDALSLSFGLGVLQFIKNDDAEVPTIASEAQNARVVASTRAHGTALNERFGWGVSFVLASERSYTTLLGIPPSFVQHDVPFTAQLGAMIEYAPFVETPLFFSLRIESSLPHPVESPFLGASRLGTVATLGLEYRRD